MLGLDVILRRHSYEAATLYGRFIALTAGANQIRYIVPQVMFLYYEIKVITHVRAYDDERVAMIVDCKVYREGEGGISSSP